MSYRILIPLFLIASVSARGATMPSNYRELDAIHQNANQAMPTDIEGAGWDGPCYFKNSEDILSESAFFYGVGGNLRTIFVWHSLGDTEDASRHYREVEWAAQPYGRIHSGLRISVDANTGTKNLLHKFNEPDNGWMICSLTLRYRYL